MWLVQILFYLKYHFIVVVLLDIEISKTKINWNDWLVMYPVSVVDLLYVIVYVDIAFSNLSHILYKQTKLLYNVLTLL